GGDVNDRIGRFLEAWLLDLFNANVTDTVKNDGLHGESLIRWWSGNGLTGAWRRWFSRRWEGFRIGRRFRARKRRKRFRLGRHSRLWKVRLGQQHEHGSIL